MGRDKKQVHQDDQPKPIACDGTEVADDDDPEIMPPETAEDFLLVALEKSDLNEIVRILRDWYGRKKIKNALNRLTHRDPVDQFTHMRRHAVELYAKNHKITPSTLMVKLTGALGVDERDDAAGTERHKLRAAREHVKQDRNALYGARALAECWEESRPTGRDPVTHLRNLERKFNIPSSEPKPEF